MAANPVDRSSPLPLWAQVEADLRATLDFAPEHVSTYALTLEEGTPFARAVASGRLRVRLPLMPVSACSTPSPW